MAWDFTTDRPVYLQIMEVVKQRIIKGEYKIGEKLPSVRELADEARVNPNTMQKAMSELEREGLIFSQRTSGRFVTCDEMKVQQLRISVAEKIVSDFLEKMQGLGFDQEKIIELISTLR